jgi:hypothetical protein
MSDEEIIKVIEVALSNKDELLKKIEMMKEIVKNYELSKYPEKLYYSLR